MLELEGASLPLRFVCVVSGANSFDTRRHISAIAAASPPRSPFLRYQTSPSISLVCLPALVATTTTSTSLFSHQSPVIPAIDQAHYFSQSAHNIRQTAFHLLFCLFCLLLHRCDRSAGNEAEQSEMTKDAAFFIQHKNQAYWYESRIRNLDGCFHYMGSDDQATPYIIGGRSVLAHLKSEREEGRRGKCWQGWDRARLIWPSIALPTRTTTTPTKTSANIPLPHLSSPQCPAKRQEEGRMEMQERSDFS